MKTILVVGATGFVGSHTLHWLSRQSDIKLIAACRAKVGLPAAFAGEVREGDLRNENYLSTLLDGVDVVVNAMSWGSLFGHKKQSNELFYEPSVKLIEAFMESRAARFVNISTISAAAPDKSEKANSMGIPRNFWPHLNNIIKIENLLRQQATVEKTMINLRFGIFVGEHYSLGVIPILVPRLKTHLVPWVQGGETEMSLIDGRDTGQAMGRAALAGNLQGYESFNILGQDIPTVRDIITYLHQQFGYPKPHFSVPFKIAYPFGWLMEKLDIVSPWEPLIVRSIIHLLENTHANNNRATKLLQYQPKHNWKDAIKLQIVEMNKRQTAPMSMTKAIDR